MWSVINKRTEHIQDQDIPVNDIGKDISIPDSRSRSAIHMKLIGSSSTVLFLYLDQPQPPDANHNKRYNIK